MKTFIATILWEQGSCDQHGAHLGPTGPWWAPCWSHELCYLGSFTIHIDINIHVPRVEKVCQAVLFTRHSSSNFHLTAWGNRLISLTDIAPLVTSKIICTFGMYINYQTGWNTKTLMHFMGLPKCLVRNIHMSSICALSIIMVNITQFT